MRNIFIISIPLFFLLSCEEPIKVKIEIPVESAVKLSDYQEIFVTNFLVSDFPKDFKADKEIANFIINEFKSAYSINPNFKEVKFESGDKTFSDADFWKNLNEKTGKTLILTGIADIKEERRNIVQESSPYATFPERRIVQMKFFKFNLKVFLIDSSSGSIISSRTFKEEKGYEDPETPLERGFMDIMQRITNRYLKDLFQKKIEEERYIIY
ncbi:MAG: hypothetical protein ACUVUG_06965 [Candidatus Aminicenantia bacterium]